MKITMTKNFPSRGLKNGKEYSVKYAIGGVEIDKPRAFIVFNDDLQATKVTNVHCEIVIETNESTVFTLNNEDPTSLKNEIKTLKQEISNIKQKNKKELNSFKEEFDTLKCNLFDLRSENVRLIKTINEADVTFKRYNQKHELELEEKSNREEILTSKLYAVNKELSNQVSHNQKRKELLKDAEKEILALNSLLVNDKNVIRRITMSMNQAHDRNEILINENKELTALLQSHKTEIEKALTDIFSCNYFGFLNLRRIANKKKSIK